jgi:hypothetical protein
MSKRHSILFFFFAFYPQFASHPVKAIAILLFFPSFSRFFSPSVGQKEKNNNLS